MKKAPIFEYDDRYIVDSKYTREELHKLQETVLEQLRINPATCTYELKKLGYDQKEVDTIFTMIEAKKIEDAKNKPDK